MNDERFNRDLLEVLREAAGEEAPMSLRSRIQSITDEAPLGRRLWFSPPMRISLAAATVVAVLVLAFVLMQPQNVGPGPSESPATPSPSVEESATPSPSPEATPTTAPTPVPVLSSWTGIAWQDPFAPFPYQPSVYTANQGASTSIYDVLAWTDRFVAVGCLRYVDSQSAVFFTSADGVSWTEAGRFSSGDELVPTTCPRYVVTAPTGLLAIGQQRLWSSSDGVAWNAMGSPSWVALWDAVLPELMSVASGPEGIVAIGTDRDTGETIAAHSPDGRVWHAVDLPAEELPIMRDVTAYPGGFVIVGRDGQPDGEASSDHPAPVPGVGRAAAWTSVDGVTWNEASVPADPVQSGGMAQVLVGSDGLFAVGSNTASDYYPSTDYEAGDVVAAWTSVDGISWEAAGALGADLPPMALLASDGTNMVGLGLRQPSVGQEATAWASVDGLHWSSLTVSGPALDVGYLALEPLLLDSPPDTAIWVLPDGLIGLGAGDGVPINEAHPSQWFRFASALTR
jgi:hypothetical protein